MFDSLLADLMRVPDKILCEIHEEGDACDVIVRMENGAVYTALFATIPYIRRQMALTLMVAESIPEAPPVRYAVLDTPHIVVESLERAIIEDAIDNLVAQDVFESLFTRVTDDEPANYPRTISGGERATQAVAAVVIEDVLVVVGAE